MFLKLVIITKYAHYFHTTHNFIFSQQLIFYYNNFYYFFSVCLHFNVNFVEFTIYLLTTIVAIDALEAWLKHKHRTTCLKKLANHNGAKLSAAAAHLQAWIKLRWSGYIDLRETNHTKVISSDNFNYMLLCEKFFFIQVLIIFSGFFVGEHHFGSDFPCRKMPERI